MSSSSCMAPEPNKRLCPECAKSGYQQEVVVLQTYGGRTRNIVNLDGSPHKHLFNLDRHAWYSISNRQ